MRLFHAASYLPSVGSRLIVSPGTGSQKQNRDLPASDDCTPGRGSNPSFLACPVSGLFFFTRFCRLCVCRQEQVLATRGNSLRQWCPPPSHTPPTSYQAATHPPLNKAGTHPPTRATSRKPSPDVHAPRMLCQSASPTEDEKAGSRSKPPTLFAFWLNPPCSSLA